jgi:hypothetical protein
LREHLFYLRGELFDRKMILGRRNLVIGDDLFGIINRMVYLSELLPD